MKSKTTHLAAGSAGRRCSACGGTPELYWSRHDAMKCVECKCGRGVEEYDTFSDADVWDKWDKQNPTVDHRPTSTGEKK